MNRHYVMAMIVFAYISVIGYINPMSAEIISHTLRLQADSLQVDTVTSPQGVEYSRISGGKDWQYSNDNPGSPMIPVKILKFLVPTYSNNFHISMQYENEINEISLPFALYPCQEEQSVNDYSMDFFTSPTQERYINTNNYPSARILNDYFIDGFKHIVTVEVSPLIYDYSQGMIDLYSNINLSLSYDECAESDMASSPVIPEEYVPSMDLSEIVVNQSADLSSKSRQLIAPSSVSLLARQYYYIIVPSNLESGVERLATWKRTKGYEVTVKTIEDILKIPGYEVGNGNIDKAESLRKWLKAEYAKHNNMYVLLVGDYRTSMPIRKCINTNYSDSIVGNVEQLLPTDAYFCDLTSDWNICYDNTFKEYVGNYIKGSYYRNNFSSNTFNSFVVSPSLPLGRLLCSKVEEIENYTNKLILYESDPGRGESSYLRNAFVFKQTCFADESTMITDLPDTFNITEYVGTTEWSRDAFPSGTEVIQQIGRSGISSWFGHGNPGAIQTTGWSWEQKKMGSDLTNFISALDGYSKDECYINDSPSNGIDNLTNYDSPGVAYSISCSVTPFDKLEKDIPYNMGSAYTVAGKFGGVAFFGNTRNGYVVPSGELEHQFGSLLSNYRKAGKLENLSKIKAVTTYSMNYYACVHNLIGDPEFEIWYGWPKYIYASGNYSSNGVSVSSSYLKNSIISIYDGKDKQMSYRIPSNSSIANSITVAYDWFSNRYSSMPVSKGYCINVSQTGYVPTIFLVPDNAVLSMDKRSFVVNRALFSGNAGTHPRSKYTVDLGGVLDVYALNSVTVEENGIVFREGGSVNLHCDKTISISNITLDSNCVLTIEAETVNLNNMDIFDFATLTVRAKNINIGENFNSESRSKVNLVYVK